MELRQLLLLKSQGETNRQIAQKLDLNRNTVNTYIRMFQHSGYGFEELIRLSDDQLAELLPCRDETDLSRYEELASHFSDFDKQMSQRGATLQALWHEYRRRCPDGYGYTRFVYHYNQWRNKTVNASGILQHEAADKLMADFAGTPISYTDRHTGRKIPAQMFVAILPCSHYTYARAVGTQQREDIVSCFNGCLMWLGGVPRMLQPDNMPAVVDKAHKYAPTVNKTLMGLAQHYGCHIDPTRPRSPKDKALVENAVNLVYQRIYYPLSAQTFFSLSDLNKAIGELLEDYNTYVMHTHQISRRQLFVEVERDQLNPLPGQPYRLRHYKRAKVQKISHVYLSASKNYYSVPHRYIGKQVEVQYNSQVVEIYYQHCRIAHHKRSHTPGTYTTEPEHMPEGHQVYNHWSPDYFRRQAGRIGPACRRYVSRLIEQHRYPQHAYKQAQGILAMTRHYPDERVEAACQRGLAHASASYHTIRNILRNGQDQTPQGELELPESAIPDHDNIRGGGYYY